MNATDLINYLNYFFLGVIALSALLGFWFGAFRSIYFFAGFLALFVIGWFLSPVLARVLFTVDMSALGTISDIEITTIEGVIPSLLEKISPEMGEIFAPGSGIYDFGVAAVLMTLRLVTFSVWLIVVIPILTFVLWIVYLFIKPKRKKTLVSRFIGVGVTVLHSLLSLFILSIFLAGLTSAAHSAISLTETAPSEDEPAQIIFTDQGPMLRLDNAEFEEFDFIFEFAGNYRESYLGKMSGLIKIDKAGLDEYMFDELFSLKYRKTKIKLRKELATVIRLYDLIAENVEGEINLESLVALPEEVKEQIVEEVKRLKILRVAIPLGIEYVVASGVLEKELGDLEEYLDIEKVIPELLEIDYEKEIGYLAAAFLDALALELHKMGENSQLLLTLDADTVDSLLDNVGSLQIIDIVGNEMLAAFVVSEAAQNFYEKIGFTKEIDLEGVEIGSEIKNLGKIYRAFASFGITTTDYKEIDFSQITDGHINELGEAIFGSTLFSKNGGLLACALVNQLPEEYRTVITVNQFELNDFTSIAGLGLVLFSVGFFEEGADPQPADLLTEDNIEKIADYISCSGLLSSNVGGILNMLMQAVELPEGLEIAIDSEFNWSGESGRAEIVALFTAANKLLELGIGESEDFLSSLTEAKIEELSDALAESQIFMSNIENILNYFLTDPEITGGMEFTIREMDWPSPAGKAEFKALLHAVATIYETDLLDNPEPTEFTNEQIDKLASALSASIIIRDNLSNIIVQAVGESVDFEIAVFDNPDDWTETEIGSLLRAARIISGKENYLVFTEEEADVLLASNLIVDSIVLLLEKYTEPEGELYDLLIIDGITDWRDTYEGEVRVDGELRRFFNASRILLGDNPDINDPDSLIDLNRLLNLSDGSADVNGDGIVDEKDDQIAILTASRIIVDTAVKELKTMTAAGGELYEVLYLPVDDEVEYHGPDGEMRRFIIAIKHVAAANTEPGQGISDIDQISIASLTDADTRDDIVASKIIATTIIVNIEIEAAKEGSAIALAPELDRNNPDSYDPEAWDAELPKFLDAIAVFTGDSDINDISFGAEEFLNISDEDIDKIVDSRVISYSIIKKLEDEHNSPDSLITIPDQYGPAPAEATNEALWYEGGELRRTLRALRELGINDYEDKFPLQAVFAEAKGEVPEVILASEIVENTIVKRIETEADGGRLDGVLIYPADWDPADWYGLEGELRKFLVGIEVIVGTEDFENATFEADRFLGDDRDKLLSSRLIEASAVEYIIDSADSEGGALSGALYLPEDLETNNVNWYRSGGGELDRFLDAIKIIVGDGGEYGDANFAVDTILGAERDVLLDSRVVEHSAIVYIMSCSEKLTIPDKSEDRYYYLTGDLVWVRTYDENDDLVDEGELRRFLSGIDYILYILGDDADFETFVFEMDNFLEIENFTEILASRVLEATLADMTEEVLASEALIGFIKEPDGGYQWFRHAESEEEGITGVVRRGEYALTETTYQYSDLAGFLDAVRQMNAANLNYNYINAYTIASSASDNSEKLAEALWDYSRVMRGSIATMLNEAIDRISVPPIFEQFKPVFTDDDFQNKDDVQEKLLYQFAAFIDMIS